MGRNRATWSREQCREMGERGRLAQALRRKTVRDFPPIQPANGGQPTFAELTLSRTRAQVSGLLDLMDKERCRAQPDGQRLNWLASALERLAELERVLDGRPLPGSRRPAAEGNTRVTERNHLTGPIGPASSNTPREP